MNRNTPIQLFVREAAQGDAVSLLIVMDGEPVEMNLAPFNAMELSLALVKTARAAQFGASNPLPNDAEAEIAPSNERTLDLAGFCIDQVLQDLKPTQPAVANCAAVGTA